MAAPSSRRTDLKNIDDVLLYGRTLEDLELQIEKLMKLCKKINLKLAPSKCVLNTAVKFKGTIISAEKKKFRHILRPTGQKNPCSN